MKPLLPHRLGRLTSRKSGLGSFGFLMALALLLGLVGIASVAWSDSEIVPKATGGGWGDPNESSNLLQMTKDPQTVRDRPMTPEERDHAVPAHQASSDCLNSSGRLLDEGSLPGRGRSCSMNSDNAGNMKVNSVAQPNSLPTAGRPQTNSSQGLTLSP